MLLVTSLMAMIGLAVYHSLINGIKIWDVSNRYTVEEDIAIFFEKISQDLRNAFPYSKIDFRGDHQSIAFPRMVHVLSNSQGTSSGGRYLDQIGKVEYYFDVTQKKILKKQADYGQALTGEFAQPQEMTGPVERLNIDYIYLTDKEEIHSEQVLETFPSSVQVEVTFSDNMGSHLMKKIIDLPMGS